MITPSNSTPATRGVDNLLELKDVHYKALQEAKASGAIKKGLWVLAYDNEANGSFGFVNIQDYIDAEIKKGLSVNKSND